MRAPQAVSMALLGVLTALAASAQIVPRMQNSARAVQPLVLEMANQTGGPLMVGGLPSLGPPMLGIPNAPFPPGAASLPLDAGAGLPAPFYQWVSAAIDGKGTGATLWFRGVDAGGKSVRTALYSDAKVSEVGVPELDRKSNAALTLRVKTAGAVKLEPAATDQKVRSAAKPDGSRWRVSAFRLVLGDLSTGGVQRIGSFTLTPGGALTLALTLDDGAAVSFGRFALEGKQLFSRASSNSFRRRDRRSRPSRCTGCRWVRSRAGRGCNPGASRAPGPCIPANYVSLRVGLAGILFAPQIAQ